MVALAMTVLMGFVALSVDYGYAVAQRRQVQTAVDSAALAAADSALANASTTDVINTAKSYGAANANVPTSAVTVTRPPTTGSHAGDSNYIQVSITKSVPRLFSGIIDKTPWQVSATAMSAVVPGGFDAAILALNGGSGGIKTSGSSTIKVTGGGSIVSNYNFNTSGNTTITTDGWIASNQGFVKSGTLNMSATLGVNASAAQMADPLLTKITPPTFPTFPSDPITDFTPAVTQACISKPGWSPSKAGDYLASPGLYCSGGSSASVLGNKITGYDVFEFQYGNYKFNSNTAINIALNGSLDTAQLDGGNYIFNGASGGISISGTTNNVILKKGNYAFLTGASLNISGNAPNNVLCDGALTYNDCTVYFSGGGGISAGGSNHVTLNPGTYIFDGGTGISMSGGDQLTFNAGTYKFYFRNGAGLSLSGSSTVNPVGSPYVQMWFSGSTTPTTTWSNFSMSGNTNMQLPTGEYYFDHGNLTASGSTVISGTNVFFYFKNLGYLQSSGGASFGFTAPTTTIYPGYYPGVFIYADRADNATFTWTGTTSSVSQGVIYIPDSKLIMTGSSNAKVMTGQIIANSFDLSGNNNTQVQYQKYVATTIPKSYLVQ